MKRSAMQLASPSARFKEITKNINKCSSVVGVDILALKMKFNYRFWTMIISVASYVGFTLYTMVESAKHDWKASLKASVMFAGLFHGLGKLITALLRSPEMRRIAYFARDIYIQYEQKGANYCSSLDHSINRLLRMMKLIAYGYILTYSCLTVMPLVFLIYNDSRFTIMYNQIPGLKLDQTWSYSVTYLIQLLTIIVVAFSFFAGDLFVVAALSQIFTFADIFHLKVGELNEALGRKASARRVCEVGAALEEYADEVDVLLMGVIKWHQMFTNYTLQVNTVYYELIASQVLSSAASVMITFCIILTDIHPYFVVYIVVVAYSMVVYCILGTKIEFTHDQVYDDICNIPWYELGHKQRKLYAFMMYQSQHPHSIKLLGVMPLSMNTALQITKLIYSISMMVMQNRT